MTKKEQKLDRFDRLIPAERWVNPWRPDGAYEPDHQMLTRLLSVAVGTAQQSGIVAAAADVWAAEELRRAGFDADEVWPRRLQPRIFPRDIRNFIEGGALPKKLRAEVESRLMHPKARKALPSEAHVLGSAYSKQADVVVASWAAGVEVLISTKTMLRATTRTTGRLRIHRCRLRSQSPRSPLGPAPCRRISRPRRSTRRSSGRRSIGCRSPSIPGFAAGWSWPAATYGDRSAPCVRGAVSR